MTQDTVADAAAKELAQRIVTDDLVDRVAQSIVEKMRANPFRDIDKIRVICPFPIDPEETSNEFAPALNALVSVRLGARLSQILDQNGLDALPVISEFDPEHFNADTAILNVVQNDRGSTSDPEPGKEGLVYSERLVRQAVYTGEVDQNAIYVPVDDFLVAQSTLASLMSYIQSNGGLTTNAVTGCQLFTGINVMAPTQASLDYLNAVIGDDVAKDNLKQVLSRVGLNIDFDDLEANTVSNVEMIFVAGVLADSENPEHKAAFGQAIQAIGSTLEEAQGNSPSDIFHAAPMSVEDMAEHFEKVLDVRMPLIDMRHERITQLTASGGITNFKLEA